MGKPKDIKLHVAGRPGHSVDPAFDVTLGPIKQWVQAVHAAAEGGEVSARLMDKALAAAIAYPKARMVGPAHGILLTLGRLGWKVLTAQRWCNEDDQTIDLTELSAAYVERLAFAATWRWVAKQVARSQGSPT